MKYVLYNLKQVGSIGEQPYQTVANYGASFSGGLTIRGTQYLGKVIGTDEVCNAAISGSSDFNMIEITTERAQLLLASKDESVERPTLMEPIQDGWMFNLNQVSSSMWTYSYIYEPAGLAYDTYVNDFIRTKYNANQENALINSYNKGLKVEEYTTFLRDVELYKYTAQYAYSGSILTNSGSDAYYSGLTYVKPVPVEVINMTSTSSFAPAQFPTLPDTGVWLDINTRWNYSGSAVQVRQSHFRTEHAPSTVPALFSVYRTDTGSLAWTANEPVIVGSKRSYSAKTWKCIQAHVTQVGWEPPKVPALWNLVPTNNNWAAGVAYKVNDQVVYVPNGFTYKCLQAHSSIVSWEPPNAASLWQKV